jgi:drug/metabolite transporter (DMT)-like permease
MSATELTQGERPGIGIALAILAAFLLSCLDATVKYVSAETTTPMILWARYVFHIALILAVVLPTRSAAVFHTGRPWLQLARSMLLFGATGCFFTALRTVPLADATSILFLAPILVTAFSMPLLGERVGPRRWSAVFVGFLGVLLVIRPGITGHDLAILLPLGSALSFSLFLIVTRVIGRTDKPLTTLLYSTAVGAVVLSALLPLFWQPPGPRAWVFLVLIGVLGAAGHYLMILALRYVQASTVAPFLYMQLVAAVSFGYLLFEETPDAVAMLGALFIVGSGLYVWHRERRLATGAAK